MQLDTPEYCYILDMCALPETSRCGPQDYLCTYYYLLVSNPLGSSVLEGRYYVIILYCYCIMFQCTIWVNAGSPWKVNGQRFLVEQTYPTWASSEHHPTQTCHLLVGDMWWFPGGYQYTWYYLLFWTSKLLGFPNLVEHYLLSCSPFETSAIHFTTDSQGCARLEPTLQPPVITVETTCRYRSVRAFKSKWSFWRR